MEEEIKRSKCNDKSGCQRSAINFSSKERYGLGLCYKCYIKLPEELRKTNLIIRRSESHLRMHETQTKLCQWLNEMPSPCSELMLLKIQRD